MQIRFPASAGLIAVVATPPHQGELPGGHRLRLRDSTFGMGSGWSPVQVRPADRPEPQLYATIRRSMTVLGCVKIGLPAPIVQ